MVDVAPEADVVRAYEEAGADRAIVGMPEEASLARLEKIASALLPTV